MPDRPARFYLVINPGPLFGARRVTFPSPAPAGPLARVDVGGRLIRVLLTGTPLNGGLRAAAPGRSSPARSAARTRARPGATGQPYDPPGRGSRPSADCRPSGRPTPPSEPR
ncbi:hypothetical protein [Streptomyces sp. NWU339]|uniref:hypothetical protein n=1 Tax=Streptomyces sp. NWU339 TaxID=2185284 RepID=UPI0015E7F4F5|nr:hypothetical protein [Streptomyces sp. NWU339]